MHKHLIALLAAGVLATSGGSAFAHHPFTAEYDTSKPAQVEGKVTKVNWVNPHSFLTVSVKDVSGKVNTYRVELGSPGALEQKGWKRGSVKVGEVVTVDGWLARDGARQINARTVTVKASGHEFNAASSFEGAVKQSGN